MSKSFYRRGEGRSYDRRMAPFIESPRLPVIDLSLFDAGDPWRDHVAAQVDWAASTFGFFYIVGHGIDAALTDGLMELSRRFFAQELAAKQAIHMSRAGRAWRGYFPVGGELTSGRPDRKEGLYFGSEHADEDARVRANTPLHGHNQFPSLPGFAKNVHDYMAALTGLGHKLMTTIARGLGLADSYFVDRFTGDPTILFRIFNYPATRDASEWGVGAHSDYGLLTILKQDAVGGLQLRYGETWVDVPDVPGSFVCNIGDMLERLTNGRYVSALHRVKNSASRDRISMPFFFDPGFDAVLESIPGIRPPAPRENLFARWDGIDLRDVHGTYGEYLLGKVAKVFPDLGRTHIG
jgi:isopenicillin N synthase-like dioxygenase